MGIVLFLQIHHFRTDITNRTTFVSHIADTHITGHRELSAGILYDMVVAIQHTRHAGGIGDDGGDFLQVELMEAECQVLQGVGISIL